MKSSSSWTWSTAEHNTGTHESAVVTSSMMDPLSESEVSSEGNSGVIRISSNARHRLLRSPVGGVGAQPAHWTYRLSRRTLSVPNHFSARH